MKIEQPSEKLADVQLWLQKSLIEPSINLDSTSIEHYLSATDNLTAAQHLAIYQRSYYSRLLECMREQFKALLYTLGDELFDDFARMYLSEFPSTSPNLADLGERFPAFLESNRPDKDSPETWVNFMIAMAQFEVDLYRIFDEEGSENDKFADVFTDDKNLKLQKCFALHQYPFEVNKYYQAVAEDKNPELTPPRKTFIAFVRNNYQVYVVPLTEAQFTLLGWLNEGKPVAEAIENLAKQNNFIPERVHERWLEWKDIWIKKGFFVNVENNSD
jgi:hypothetical protein